MLMRHALALATKDTFGCNTGLQCTLFPVLVCSWMYLCASDTIIVCLSTLL